MTDYTRLKGAMLNAQSKALETVTLYEKGKATLMDVARDYFAVAKAHVEAVEAACDEQQTSDNLGLFIAMMTCCQAIKSAQGFLAEKRMLTKKDEKKLLRELQGLSIAVTSVGGAIIEEVQKHDVLERAGLVGLGPHVGMVRITPEQAAALMANIETEKAAD